MLANKQNVHMYTLSLIALLDIIIICSLSIHYRQYNTIQLDILYCIKKSNKPGGLPFIYGDSNINTIIKNKYKNDSIYVVQSILNAFKYKSKSIWTQWSEKWIKKKLCAHSLIIFLKSYTVQLPVKMYYTSVVEYYLHRNTYILWKYKLSTYLHIH